jgi:multiple sugar transport system substrate-binding protein
MLTKNQIIILGAVAFVIIFFILGLLDVIPIFKSPEQQQAANTQTPITFWGVNNNADFKNAFEIYSTSHPNVLVRYQQFDESNYENALLNALATGKGPDVFMFHRSWAPKHGDKILAASDTQFSLYNLRQLFPDVIEKDFVSNQKIVALPLYLDTLALFYNKDIFNAKGIALTPTTWDEFKNLLPSLTEFDFSHNIKKAAAAIGGSNTSVNKASDLLSLLMLQTNPSFSDYANRKNNFGNKALEAFNFYLQFANPSSNAYTWSENFGNSINAFASGDVAMIFNYSREIKELKQKNPYLNFGVSAMPQINITSPVNYADYWGLAVSKQSKNPQIAWSFVVSMTTNQQIANAFSKDSNSPSALRTLINQNLTDVNMGVFAKQTLTAKSVYQSDKNIFSQSISNMIESVLTGKTDSGRALQQAASEINGQQ